MHPVLEVIKNDRKYTAMCRAPQFVPVWRVLYNRFINVQVLRERAEEQKKMPLLHMNKRVFSALDFGFRSPVSPVSSDNRRHDMSCTIMWKRPGPHDRHLHPENPPSHCKTISRISWEAEVRMYCAVLYRGSDHQSPCLFIVQCCKVVKVLKKSQT